MLDSEGDNGFYSQFLPSTSGTGWSLSSPLATPQLTEAVETSWVQITLESVHKVHYILMQQKKGEDGQGKYWIKYGLSDNALKTYQSNGQTKVRNKIKEKNQRFHALFILHL